MHMKYLHRSMIMVFVKNDDLNGCFITTIVQPHNFADILVISEYAATTNFLNIIQQMVDKWLIII